MSQSTIRPEQGAADRIIETVHLGTEICDDRPGVPVWLRTLIESDAVHLLRMDFLEYFRTWTHSGPLTDTGARSYIRSWRTWASIPTRWRAGGQVISRPDTIHLAIMLHSIQYPIGFCRISIEHDLCKIELGLELIFQNRGYGTQALIMVIDWAFTKVHSEGLQMTTVQINAPQANTHIQYVMETKMRFGAPILIRQGSSLDITHRWTVRHNEWVCATTHCLRKYRDEA